MTDHAVVIAGAGPTGLMLAGELALAGVDVAIVERRAARDRDVARAGGLHARTIEILDQRGIAERFLSQGRVMQINGFAMIPMDISDFPTRHNYGVALPQIHTERTLAEWVAERGVRTYQASAVTGFAEDDSGVDVSVSGGPPLRAQYLVGCDGGRSVVRRTAGIEFPGLDPTVSWIMADVEMSEEPRWGFHYDAVGAHAIGKGDKPGQARVVVTERNATRATRDEGARQPTLADLRDALVAAYGTDFGAHSPASIARFSDVTRQAARYRAGRILLAGDAANVRPPMGGQGLNVGVHDAVNLGWKLAQVVTGASPDTLLDTYHAERHPAVARVLRNVLAQVPLRHGDERTKALKETLGEVLRMNEPRRAIAGLMSGLDVHYDLGAGHPLLGRRMPDVDLDIGGNTVRMYSLMHAARPVLVNFGTRGALDAAPWGARVHAVDARYDGRWELPVIGLVDGPAAVLVRPDGHVAWVGNGTADGLIEALTYWVGAP